MALGTNLPQRLPLSSGTVYYVGRVNGNDTRTTVQAQTKATPWKTIQGALNALKSASAMSNAIVKLIPDGEYTEAVNVSGIKGVAGQPITITADYTTVMGDLGTKPRITYPTIASQGFKFTGSDYIRWSYLNFQGDGNNSGSPTRDSGIFLVGPSGGPSDNSFSPNFGLSGDDGAAAISGATGRLEIDHCDFLDCHDQAIYAGGNSNGDVNDLHIRYNTFKRSGRAWTFISTNASYYYPGHVHAMYLAHTNRALVLNNEIDDVPAGNGVQLYPECCYATVTGNTIAAVMRNGVIIGGDGNVYNGGVQRPSKCNLIINNVISNLPSALTTGSPPANPANGASATFTTQNPGNYGYGVGVDFFWGGTQPSGNYVKNNNIYHVKTTVSTGGGLNISGTTTFDPSYTSSYDGTSEDGSGSTYHGASTMFPHGGGVSKIWSGPDHSSGRDVTVQAGSSIIGIAVDSWLPTVDLAGNSRSTVTLGAYEGGGGGGGGSSVALVTSGVISYSGSANEASHTFSLAANVATGHHLILTVAANNNNLTWTVTDTKGNSYQTDARSTGTTNGESDAIISAFIASGLVAGVDTITVTPVSSTTFTVYADEWSGLATSSWLDVAATPNEQAGVSSPVSGSLTTTKAVDLLVGMTVWSGVHSPSSPGAGLTTRQMDLGSTGSFIRTQSSQYQVTTTTGTYTSTITLTGTSNTESLFVAYKSGATAVTKTLSAAQSHTSTVGKVPGRVLRPVSAKAVSLVKSPKVRRAVTVSARANLRETINSELVLEVLVLAATAPLMWLRRRFQLNPRVKSALGGLVPRIAARTAGGTRLACSNSLPCSDSLRCSEAFVLKLIPRW